MSSIPSVNYKQIINCLQRLGFVVVRQKGSHIRLHKHSVNGTIKITVPAHSPVKKFTLKTILQQANVSLAEFLENI